MTINPGEEFKLRATPSQALLRKLAYLAESGSDSVLTGNMRSGGNASTSARKTQTIDTMLQMTRLADPGYQALSAQINDDLDRMDEASVRALQEIEEELLAIRHERERIRAEAYHDEQGRLILMNADRTAAFYEDRTQLPDEEFEAIRGQLVGKPTWDDWTAIDEHEAELLTERDVIHRHDAEREALREGVNAGSVSAEDAKRRFQEIEDSLPERVRYNYNSQKEPAAESEATSDVALSPDEEASLRARDDPHDSAGSAGPQTPGAATF